MNPKSIYVDLNKFEILNVIGKGGFGKVIRVQERESGNIYAAKISIREIDDRLNEEFISLLREVNFLSSMNHPAILKFIGFNSKDFDNNPNPVIITEYLANGSLKSIIEAERMSNSPDDWDNTKKLINIYGIASAMTYLHKNNIIHRDLKPENILEDDYLFPKIADFGLSKKAHSNQFAISYQSQIGIKGTLAYMAPEIFDTKEYTKQGDVYSFAYIVYEIITNKNPFQDCDLNLFYKIAKQGERPEFPSDTPECFKILIEACWDQDPSKRPTFEQIVEVLEKKQEFKDFILDDSKYEDYIYILHEANDSIKSNKPFDINDIVNQSKLQSFKKVIFNIQNEAISKDVEMQKISEIEDEREAQFLLEKLSKSENLNNLPEETIKFLTNQLNHTYSKVKNLELFQKDINLFYNNGSLKSKEFRNILKYFDSISINVDYPSKNFDDVMKIIGKIKKKNEIINVSVNISGIREIDNVLSHDTSINIINIEAPMRTIGNEAFRGCSSLVEIYLPCSISEIGDWSFSECSSLSRINIPSDVKRIGSHAFYECTSLNPISIPSTVTTIEEFTFFGCSSLTEIEIPSSITSIKNNSFCGCTSLVNIEIPNSVELIGEHSFSECVSLSRIVIPNKITKIQSSLFSDCSSLVDVKIPDSVIEICDGSFSGCSNLTHISIPSSVQKIGRCAFKDCSSLQEIDIPNSVQSIEEHCFSGCISLLDVLIPDSVIEIKDYSFNECVKLDQINIPDSVKFIGSYFLYGCSSLSEISIPSSVTEINEYSFGCCSSLLRFNFHSSISKISMFAFSECSSLTEIDLPSSITKIEGFMFNECTSLEKVTIPSSVTEIDKYAFVECSKLKKIKIPSSVTKIGEYCFSGCSSLIEIEIPESITRIENWTFFACNSLVKIILPNSLSFIGESAFSKCLSLKEIEIPESVNFIGKYAFSACEYLSRFSIPNSVKEIEKGICSGCKNLSDISIPSSVTKINKFAFKGCSKLNEVTIPSSVTEIIDQPFIDCPSITKIVVPSSMKKSLIYKSFGVDKMTIFESK